LDQKFSTVWENVRKRQSAFRPMVNILNIYGVNWVVALNMA